MNVEQLAVLAYGIVAMVAALILSSQVGSPVATALVFAAAGFTYLFQVVQLETRETPLLLFVASIGALLASVIASLWSAF